MKSFPNPLTPSEEKYYIQKYTEGDLEAKHILIERNLRLVAHVVKKYQNLEEDPEDLISIGTIGLIKAVVTFNPDKGNRLAAYASRCVENEVLMYLRSKKKNGKEISLYEPIGTDREGNEIKLYDIMETDEADIPEKIYLKENIQKLYEEYAVQGEDAEVVILGAAAPGMGQEGTEEEITQFMRENGYTYPVLMDTDWEMFTWYGITSFPTTFMIDREGNIFGYVPGQMTEEIMRSIIDQTLEG